MNLHQEIQIKLQKAKVGELLAQKKYGTYLCETCQMGILGKPDMEEQEYTWPTAVEMFLKDHKNHKIERKL